MHNHRSLTHLLISLAGLALLVSACNQPATPSVPTSLPDPLEPVATATQAAAPLTPTSESAGRELLGVTLAVDGLAQEVSAQLVAVVPVTSDRPWYESMPEHRRLTLQGYPLSPHLMQAQIFVYPRQELGMNEAADNTAGSLQDLLQTRQAGEALPHLPLYNAAQIMHAQVKYLYFKNGSGVRYLAYYSQGILPVNNYELLYTFQGLTSDGAYYVAATLPLSLPGLPQDMSITDELPEDFFNDYPKYLADTIEMLDQQPDSAFIPSLEALDALVGSLEVGAP